MSQLLWQIDLHNNKHEMYVYKPHFSIAFDDVYIETL
jgi:hypothetical protein